MTTPLSGLFATRLGTVLSCGKLALGAVSLAALLPSISSAETIYSDPADLSLKLNRTDGVTVGSNGAGESGLNVGKSGSGEGFDRAAVLVFELPDLGAVDNPFGTATLGVFLTQDTVTGAVFGDLYGLGRREFPEVEFEDYYGRENVPDPTDATLLQDDFLSPGGAPVNALATTSVEGSMALTDYLNAQYEGGAGIGQFVFLRINSDADTTRRWNILSTNGANGDLSKTPQINYILASEPVDTIQVETESDGSGVTIPSQTLVAGESFEAFAIARTAGGGFVDNVPVTWEVANATGGVVAGDLVVSGDNTSAVFNASAPGTAEILIFGNASNLIGTGTITVVEGPATQVFIESKSDGTGEPIGETFLVEGGFLEMFTIARDSAGNFIEWVPAEWSLEEVTGEVVADDLEVDQLFMDTATFFANGLGSARVRVTVDGLTPGVSGVITVAELVSLWDGEGGNSSWSTAGNWFGDILPAFWNTTDLVFHDPAITRLNLYLGADRITRSLTYNGDADRSFNIRLTTTGLTGAADLIFDTDSETDPAEIVVDADAEGNFKLGNVIRGSGNEYGRIVLVDDLLITHGGVGTLTLDGDIVEEGGSMNLTKAGVGTVVMTGTNTFSGHTTVADGVLSVNGTSLSDTGDLVILGNGWVEVAGDETVGGLVFDGLRQAPGVYGSSASAAPLENQNDFRFSGTGVVIVGGAPDAPEPEILGVEFDGTEVTLKWSSNKDEVFTVFFSTDLRGFAGVVANDVRAADVGGETTFRFPIASVGQSLREVFFRVARN